MRATLMWISVEVVSGVRIVQCHAIIDVVIDVRVMQCHAIIDVVIGVRVMLCHQAIDKSGFSTFLNFPLYVPCNQAASFIITFPCVHFVPTFAPRKRHLKCGIYMVGMQNYSHTISTHILRTALVRFPARCRRTLRRSIL